MAPTNAQEKSLGTDATTQGTGEKGERWVNIFPVGSEVHNLLVDPRDPTSIYASTYKGLFKSTNSGKLWVPFWVAPSEVGEINVRFDPADVNTIYLGTFAGERFGSYVGALLRSKDGGKTWEDITGVVKGGIHDLAIHPTSPEIIYVASEGGLFKTLNGGKSWGSLRHTGDQVFLNPGSPEEVYAGGLYYSKDGGDNFDCISPKSIVTPVRDAFGGEKTREVEVGGVSYASLNPHNPHELFASAHATWGGVYTYTFLVKSTDRGRSWRTLLDKAAVKALAFHPNDRDVIYAVVEGEKKEAQGDKILKSVDGGRNWIRLSSPYSLQIGGNGRLHQPPDEAAVNVSDMAMPFADTLYAATDYGIYRSTNDGKSWEPASFGLPVRIGRRKVLCVEPTEQPVVYVADELGEQCGYWVSHDEGLTWKWHFGPDKEGKYSVSSSVKQLVTTRDGTKYIVCQRGVFKLTPDGKRSALRIPFAPRDRATYSCSAIFPFDAKILYAVGNAWASNTVLLKSEDGGFSWIEIDWKAGARPRGSGRGRWYEMTLLGVGPQSPDTLYITVGAEDDRSATLKSVDGGKSWVDISNGLRSPPDSIVIDGLDSNVIYAHSHYDLLRSDDGGQTWKSIGPSVEHISIDNIAVDDSNSKVLYVATNEGIYRSSDSGKTWQLLNRGLLEVHELPGLTLATVKRIVTSSSIVLAEGANGIYRLMPE
jgi:photosystem II stability/assembly factor-like uncharacterized protein